MPFINRTLVLGLALGLCAPSAFAQAPAVAKWVQDCVTHRVLSPLAKQDSKRSRFSRSGPPPDERRVRAMANVFMKDRRGREFIRYEVEARYGEQWTPAFNGCVYRGTGEVLVEFGDEFRPAEFLLGKEANVVPDACREQTATDPA